MKKIVRLTEGDLHRIIKESVKRVIRENKYGVFDVYTKDKYSPVFVRYGGESVLYEIPKELEPMLRDLDTRDGRIDFIDALSNANLEPQDIDVDLREYGYRIRSFNANAW